MTNQSEIIELVRQALKQKILFLPHALRQMSRAERMISTSEIRHVIEKGEVIEDYPEDTRGHSCLMLGFADEVLTCISVKIILERGRKNEMYSL